MIGDDCWRCRADVDSDANFCSECGAELTESRDDDRAPVERGADRRAKEFRTSRASEYETGSESGYGPDHDVEYDPDQSEYDTSGGEIDGTNDDELLAAAAHLLAIVTWVVGPAIVLVVADDPFVDENARNALNWQIVYTVGMIAATLLSAILIGIPFLIVLPFVNVAVCAIAAVKAYGGETWTYPFTPDFV
ncbi:DUF4870 domain-containing protein [Natrialba sp. INN-245]|uniref:DUF4870 domain-containing protein n=1 Tax=Natrialba sp. INN-245 TaxID=2690967 RepID=UPI0013123D13|nr:DUF4870 domain-containing protein [Natrialba sp. INN-245]MWV41607.1 DUF4870 domain-containing protein [Natrialba sp. INN-245]